MSRCKGAIVRSCVVAILSCALPRNAAATWPPDSSSAVPLCTAPYGRRDVQGVSDGAGGAIFVWRDSRSFTHDDVFAQRVSADGTTLWAIDGIALRSLTNEVLELACVSDEAGGAIVVWSESRAEPRSDLYAARIGPDGSLLWPANGIAVSTAPNNQYAPSLAPDGTGGAIVAWADARNGVDSDVYAQRIDASGVPAWAADGVTVCTAAGDQVVPFVIPNRDGGGFVTWVDYRTGDSDLRMQRVTASGARRLADDGFIVAGGPGFQGSMPGNGIPDGIGGVLLGWEGSGNSQDVFAQHFDRNAMRLWPSDPIPVCTAPADQQTPFMVADGVGGAILSWQIDGRDSADQHIFAQRVGQGGSLLWNENGVRVTAAPGRQYLAAITGDAYGGAILAWWEYPGGAPRAQRVDGSGTLRWGPNGLRLRDPAGATDDMAVVADGNGGAIVAWVNWDGVESTLLCQHAPFAGVEPVLPLRRGLALVARPNPGTSLVRVEFNLTDNGPATIEWLDLAGRRVASRHPVPGAGNQVLEFPETARLAPGVYVVRLTQRGSSASIRVVVTR